MNPPLKPCPTCHQETFRLSEQLQELKWHFKDTTPSWEKDFMDAAINSDNLDVAWPRLAVWLLTDTDMGLLPKIKEKFSRYPSDGYFYLKAVNGMVAILQNHRDVGEVSEIRTTYEWKKIKEELEKPWLPNRAMDAAKCICFWHATHAVHEWCEVHAGDVVYPERKGVLQGLKKIAARKLIEILKEEP